MSQICYFLDMAAEYQPLYDIDFWMDHSEDFNGEMVMPPYLCCQYDDLGEAGIDMDPSSGVSTPPPTVRPSAKKKMKPTSLRDILDWFKYSLADESVAETLRESSARHIAQSWCKLDELVAQLKAMGSSNMAFYFKAEIGVHLTGEALAYFIQSEGGLLTLAHRCWPEVFQRLLITIYRDISYLGNTKDIIGRRHLSKCIRLFRESAQETTSYAMLTVHRLGLTYAFEKKNRLDDDERPMLEYYDALDQRHHRVYYLPKLIYPLPPSLQLEQPAAEITGDYGSSNLVCQRRTKLRRQVSQEEFWNEERGKELTIASQRHRQASFSDLNRWSTVHNQPLLSRHFLLLTVMVYASINHAPQQVMVAAILALTHPFYAGSGMRETDPERTGKVFQAKLDIYWYLAKSLCWVHAKMDLPLACLYMAKQHVKKQPVACISELARLALLKMEIFLRYGFYTQARDLFGEWFQRVPCSSWLYEDFVMMYCAGVFYHLQDIFVEIYITELQHSDCNKLPCYNIHVEPMVRSVSNQLFLLKSILYSCLANLTIREDFRSDCKNALQLCTFYHYTVLKIGFRHIVSYASQLKHIYEKLNWDYNICSTSSHLLPFIMPLPYSVQSTMFWQELFRKAATQGLSEYQAMSGSENVRAHTDYRFTLLVSGLFHRSDFQSNTQEVFKWAEPILFMYRGCTGHRHHRIRLLEKLLWKLEMGSKVGLEGGCLVTRRELYNNLPNNSAELEKEMLAFPNLHHPKMTKRELSAQDFTRYHAQDFAQSTMRDCLNDFEYQNFSSDEMFCQYLRLRDPKVMNPCIQNGLACFRFL